MLAISRRWVCSAISICSVMVSAVITGSAWLSHSAGGAELVGHTEPVYDLTVSPDGKWLVTGSFDQSVRLWDANSLQPRARCWGTRVWC